MSPKLAPLLACSCVAMALPANHVRAQQDFAAQAQAEIEKAVPFTPPDFSIGPIREGPVGFYGKAMNEFSEISCERRATFGIIASANMAGGVNLGICVREAQRVRTLAAHARPALAGTLALLSESAKIDASLLEKFGWKYSMITGADGAEEHYFALIAIGHGIASLPTLVRVPRGGRRAIVIQADTMKLCETYAAPKKTRLCSDTRAALADIARRIDARFSEQTRN